MSPVEALREFINVRLTAAAGEIFSEFQLTVSKYRQEIDTQRSLLDISRKESRKSPTSDNLQQDLCLVEQCSYKQKNSSLGQEEPDPLQIKEEQEESELPQIEEQVQLVIKEEADTIMVTVIDEKSELGENFNSHNFEREFVNQRLTAAAVEIFSEFQQTIVQYQEEIQTQRRLLEITLKPQLKLLRRDFPEQHVCKEEDLWNQETNSSVHQEDTSAPQIKEEQGELCTSQEGETLELKQDVDTFMLISTSEQTKPIEPEPGSELLFSGDSIIGFSQHQKKGQLVDSESPRKAELKPKKRRNKKNVDSSTLMIITHTSEKSYSCVTCGRSFSHQGNYLNHLRTHTGEKPYSCVTCGKSFSVHSNFLRHIRIHTGEKPHSCLTCGKSFSRQGYLLVHMRTHTGEKPFSCESCGKCFSAQNHLLYHMKTHSGEKPHSCVTCSKSFNHRGHLLRHMRTHTGEKPFSCETCGKSYSHKNSLLAHLKTHTDEKPKSSKT